MTSPDLPDWTEEEPGLPVLASAVLRGIRRSWHRAWLVVLLATLAALALTGLRARAPRLYTARVTLRVVETTLDHRDITRLPRDLKQSFVLSALTTPRLAEIIQKRHLYPRLAATDMASAIGSFREDMRLDVSANYFLGTRTPDDPPRSARVEITYTAAAADLAADVARDLGDAILDAEQEQRVAASDASVRVVDEAIDALNVRLATLVDDRKAAQKADGNGAPSARTQQLQTQERDLVARLRRTENQRTNLELMTRAERAGLGLTIDRVYEQSSRRGGATVKSVGVTFLILIAIFLPLTALAVGSFDPRIRDEQDLAREGIPMLVELPRADRAHANRSPRAPVGGMPGP